MWKRTHTYVILALLAAILLTIAIRLNSLEDNSYERLSVGMDTGTVLQVAGTPDETAESLIGIEYLNDPNSIAGHELVDESAVKTMRLTWRRDIYDYYVEIRLTTGTVVYKQQSYHFRARETWLRRFERKLRACFRAL